MRPSPDGRGNPFIVLKEGSFDWARGDSFTKKIVSDSRFPAPEN
jgi:hypothetical protein